MINTCGTACYSNETDDKKLASRFMPLDKQVERHGSAKYIRWITSLIKWGGLWNCLKKEVVRYHSHMGKDEWIEVPGMLVFVSGLTDILFIDLSTE